MREVTLGEMLQHRPAQPFGRLTDRSGLLHQALPLQFQLFDTPLQRFGVAACHIHLREKRVDPGIGSKALQRIAQPDRHGPAFHP
ncbi:hypothetical protein D3C81_2183760 [compost metagenome]